MFGKRAAELCKDVVESTAENIPPYKENHVKQVLQEESQIHTAMSDVYREMEEENLTAASGAPNKAAAVVTYHYSILRNKRLLLAYHAKRLDLVLGNRWLQKQLPTQIEENLSPSEIGAFRAYDKLLSKYMGDGGIELDLIMDMLPPKDPLARVKVLEDYELGTATGALNLQRGTMILMKRSESAHLIQEGIVELVGESGDGIFGA